jgi:hypothetical protein
MTITISACNQEGIVLGADSTTTYSQGNQVAQLFNSAQKIFQIGPVVDPFVPGEYFAGAVATYNDACFGPVSWRNHVNAFYREKVAAAADPLDVSREFLEFTQKRWSDMQASGTVPAGAAIPNTGLMFATVNKKEGQAFGSRVELRNATVEPINVGDLQIGGGFEVVSRLLNGYDSALEQALAAAGINMGVFHNCAKNLKAIPPIAVMPLRDLVDFVHFLVYAAVKLHRYRGGPAMIGGPIEIAAVTADRGFRWIVHKPLTESIGIARGRESP